MKIVTLIVAIFAFSNTSLAADTQCQVKQKNAASYKAAQKVGVEVLSYTMGPWTEAPENNSGFDMIKVRLPNRLTKDLVIKSYKVNADQIGSSSDCNIVSVEEDLPVTFEL